MATTSREVTIRTYSARTVTTSPFRYSNVGHGFQLCPTTAQHSHTISCDQYWFGTRVCPLRRTHKYEECSESESH
eukprot:1608950-Rhodomonas_salina.4